MNSDAKKKDSFLRGLSPKVKTMMTVCKTDTYHEVVRMAIDAKENHRVHKDSKKQKRSGFSGFSGGNKKHQKITYHP